VQASVEKKEKHTIVKGNGKLLISGEYFVLDGAKAFALPCKFGQNFEVNETASEFENNSLTWKAYNSNHQLWLETEIKTKEIDAQILDTKDVGMLAKILKVCKELNPDFLTQKSTIEVTASLEFPNNWGLGSSSTLIYFMAQWANINPYLLLEKTFGGSGYDVACAQHNSGIFYTRNQINPIIEKVVFNPTFKQNIYFVHLNEKMNSRNAILYYKNLEIDKAPIIKEISALSECFVNAITIDDFERCMVQHENLVSRTLKIEKVKSNIFKDYWGEVKSLGAWGGDFVMVTNQREDQEFRAYMSNKGFDTILTYDEMILQS
jgi:mevalonate kinase